MIPRIVESVWPEARQAIEQLRHEVFIVEQQVTAELEWDDADACARHFCLWHEAQLIAYGRLLLPAADKGKLTRMAVKQSWRRKGLGRLLVQQMIKRAAELSLKRLDLDAQLHAVPFYQREGFVPVGDVFFDAGIEHIAMVQLLD
ncbi:MAG TPA: GNAT family N-acetyltransferase [Cellvibrionaceae bacterium]